MIDIFRIETAETNLSWSDSQAENANRIGPTGRLVISPSNQEKEIKIWRSGLPGSAADHLGIEVGPPLYDETTYTLLLSSGNQKRVELRHRDPSILQALGSSRGGTIVHGTINFNSQVGRSRFSVCVEGKTEYDFEVEVFPAKVDYSADYDVLVADVQEILTGLVVEYLRSTFRLGFVTDAESSSRLEWILLLRHVADELERGLRYIEQHPHHALIRERIPTRVEKIRRPDPTISKMIRQGKGRGPKRKTVSGLVLHNMLPEHRARTTLDTPEHRWLASQLTRIRRILAEIHSAEQANNAAHKIRQRRILDEIEGLQNRIARLESIEPIVQAKGFPPPEFTSLTLQARPGYREAYRACLILLRGLRVDGGPVGLSIKDTRGLYEYWCYLALIRLVSRITGEQLPVRKLFSIEKSGLRVRLKRGTSQTVKFSTGDRALELSYNPRYNDAALPQPDVVLTFHDPRRPTIRLVIDANYHVDPTVNYVKHRGSFGPPTQSVDLLHRYRDTVLHQTGLQGTRSDPLKSMVIEGVALFPYADLEDRFRNTRFLSSLEDLGIGPMPFLPRETRYLEEWLRKTLQRAGWSTTEPSTPLLSVDEVRKWQQAEKECVQIETLRQNPSEHLKWIKSNRRYSMPLDQTQPRQLSARWLAIYSPESIRKPGAITHLAEIENIEVKKPFEIDTSWQGKAEEMQVVYQLRQVLQLERPIENRGPKGLNKRLLRNPTTSRLAIMRAVELKEVLMETSAEWRLYEELRNAGVDFKLRPGSERRKDENESGARMWFARPRLQVQYRGAAGFLIRRTGTRDEYRSDVAEVVDRFISAPS